MIRPENVKPLEQNIGKNILDSSGNDFFGCDPKSTGSKSKTNRFVSPKSFYIVEVIINKETTYERAEDISKSSISLGGCYPKYVQGLTLISRDSY